MRVTLEAIRSHSPCASGWKTLLKHLGQPEPKTVALSTVLTSNGLEDAAWCLRTLPGHTEAKKAFTVECAKAAIPDQARSFAAYAENSLAHYAAYVAAATASRSASPTLRQSLDQIFLKHFGDDNANLAKADT